MKLSMATLSNPVGRPREDKNTIHFGAMLLPELIKRVRIYKAESGEKINDITANALDIYTSVATPFNKYKEQVRIENSPKEETIREVERAKTDLIRFVNEFTQREIDLKTLEQGVDSSTPSGKMVLQIFKALSDYSQEIKSKTD